MDYERMLHTLERNTDAYRRLHPATAEMDFAIFRPYCTGKTAVQIATAIPCAESTVYRAVHRVKDFLTALESVTFMDVLRQNISEFAPIYGDWDARSVLDMLYVSYCDFNRIDPEMELEKYDALHALLENYPKESAECLMDSVCDLLHSRERACFTEGMKLGVHLAAELRV